MLNSGSKRGADFEPETRSNGTAGRERPFEEPGRHPENTCAAGTQF